MHRAFVVTLCCGLLIACGGEGPTPGTAVDPAPAKRGQTPPAAVQLGAFAHVTVGVADLDTALALWRGVFGLEVAARREGPDASLAALWKLSPDRIVRQALLRTPGLTTGAIHFVEFRDPEPPVRAGARVFDRLPKNLDIYARNLPSKYEDLLSRGIAFRSRWAEMPGPGGVPFREVQIPGHDETNLVLVELVGQQYDFSPAGYAAVGPLITVVADAEAEGRFFTGVLGLEEVLRFALAGPEVEKMVGLPPGAALNFRVLGDTGDQMGRIEIVEYQGIDGEDRYGLARPPATGTLHVTWQVDDLSALQAVLAAEGVPVTEHGVVDAIYGTGPVISFTSPAGLRIEVQQK